jgi:hypothetical protein
MASKMKRIGAVCANATMPTPMTTKSHIVTAAGRYRPSV